MSWTSDQTNQFIAMVKDQLDLWNTENKNRNLVDKAWQHIADIMKMPTTELKAKLKQLISTYSNISAHMTVDDAAPIWEYYNAMDGLIKDLDLEDIVQYAEDDMDVPDVSLPWENSKEDAMDEHIHDMNNEQNENVPNEQDDNVVNEQVDNVMNEQDDDVQIELENVLDVPDDSQESNSSDDQDPNLDNRNRKRKYSDSDCDQDNMNQEMAKAFKMLNTALKEKIESKKDDVAVYTQFLAMKLRNLSPNNRQKLMHEIDGLLLKSAVEFGVDEEQDGGPNSDAESCYSDDVKVEDTEIEIEDHGLEAHNAPI